MSDEINKNFSQGYPDSGEKKWHSVVPLIY